MARGPLQQEIAHSGNDLLALFRCWRYDLQYAYILTVDLLAIALPTAVYARKRT